MLNKKIVKYIQSLSHKKLRDEHKRFLAETPKVVTELLAGNVFSCELVCAEKIWLEQNKHLLEKILPVNIYEVDEESLQKISLLKTAHKVVAVFAKREFNTPVQIAGKLSLMLDDIQDPGNLGTIIRIADWFNIENIICSENCADWYNPKVVQATMGSLIRVNIIYTSLPVFLKKHTTISVYAAALAGTPMQEIKIEKEAILIIGNESKGVSETLLNAATEKITIPKYGGAESLNAAVATAIIISHLKSR